MKKKVFELQIYDKVIISGKVCEYLGMSAAKIPIFKETLSGAYFLKELEPADVVETPERKEKT